MSETSAYLDNNATTRLDARVLESMLPLLREHWGNASSTHHGGRPVRKLVNAARNAIADRLGRRPSEIVFTASATEANNLALRGLVLASPGPSHVVISAVEHPAVLEVVRALEREGRCQVTVVGVDDEGRLDIDELHEAVRPGQTRCVSMMGANNETGACFDLEEVQAIADAAGAVLHVDAVQLVGRTDVDLGQLPGDLVALSAHKFHGPKGVGLLAMRREVELQPLVLGGGQERGLRSGTENSAAIVGMACALEIALDEQAEAVERMRVLRDELESALVQRIPGLRVSAAGAERLANTTHVTIPGVEAEPLLVRLDRAMIACSAGSACSSGALETSHVLRAMGLGRDRLHGALRFSLSRESVRADVDRVLEVLPPAVAELRALTEA